MTLLLPRRPGSPRAAVAATLLAVLATAAAACAADLEPAPPSSDPEPIFAVAEIGGCAMMGPNCVTRMLWSDGAVTAYRGLHFGDVTLPSLAALTPEDRAKVDVAVVTDLLAAIGSTDWPSLISTLPQGQCYACVDGVDLIVVLATAGGEVTINSADRELDTSFAAIAALSDAAATMSRTISLPIQSR